MTAVKNGKNGRTGKNLTKVFFFLIFFFFLTIKINKEEKKDEKKEETKEELIIEKKEEEEKKEGEETGKQESEESKREGVLKETEMLLIKTKKILCIPETQDPYRFLTEDMIEERQFVIENILSSSRSDHQTLAQYQTETLISDMSGFKAANPGFFF